MQIRLVVLACAAAVMIAAPASVGAQLQRSRCADCHYANPGSTSQHHLIEWDASKHARGNIGCETCHGGNPTTFERMQAHRGMRSPSDPRGPVSRANLPATCGTCHAGPFVAFQDSRHYALLRAGNRNVPICSTCHGDVAGLVPSPKTVEGICQSCHGDRKVAPREGLAVKAALEIAGLNELRALLDQADATIARIKDQTRRQPLLAQAQQARVPLIEAADAGHRFVYDMLDERLMVARMRIAALLEELANPSPAQPRN